MIYSTPSPRFGMALTEAHAKEFKHLRDIKDPNVRLSVDLNIISRRYAEIARRIEKDDPQTIVKWYDKVTKDLRRIEEAIPNSNVSDPYRIFSEVFKTPYITKAIDDAFYPFASKLKPEDALSLLQFFSDKNLYSETLDPVLSNGLLSQAKKGLTMDEITTIAKAKSYGIDIKEA